MEPYSILNVKPKAEKLEERVTVKIIIEGIIKALFIYIYSKVQNIYSFELIYSHGLGSQITSLSMFLMMRPKSFLLA